MIYANHFSALTDSETIENALKHLDGDRTLVITPRESDIEKERTHWLLDRAILLEENTTLIIRNATLQLSDRARDNFIRSANCGIGISYPERIKNIHIIGEGTATLLGAEHPRATGDGWKILASPCPYRDEDLVKYAYWVSDERKKANQPSWADKHDYTYGTDAGKEGESPTGDWRDMGILLANVENFTIRNLTIRDSHGYGISCEECAYGKIDHMHFDSTMSKCIDSMLHNMENQDGIDLRSGSNNIIISDITGRTGDDVIALTSIIRDEPARVGGVLHATQVMHTDWSRREKDIHDVIIRNVVAHSNLCWTVRLLAAECCIKNVVIDGIIDNTPDGIENGGALLLGEHDGSYGKNHPDSIRNITVSNVISKRASAVNVLGYVSDSAFTNIIHQNKNAPAILVYREDGLKNTLIQNVVSASGRILERKEI